MRITRTTLYERLRKRSYRNLIRSRVTEREHEAYLQGVRDAMSAFRLGARNGRNIR